MNTIEENRHLENEKASRVHNANMKYQQDLQGQINYNNELKHLQNIRDEEEYRLGMQAELEYQHKLQNCLDDPQFEKLHPMRRALAARSAQQLRE